tara:strand:+ start:257 stop:598 length:342 start_codon:yes stop_codon:yes gene_type:complete
VGFMASMDMVSKDLSNEIRKNSEQINELVKKETYRPTGISVKKIQHGSLAYRMMLELVVGVVVGVGIGYGLDRLFDTFPIFLIIFSLLGFFAGIRVMLQTANQINSNNEKSDS